MAYAKILSGEELAFCQLGSDKLMKSNTPPFLNMRVPLLLQDSSDQSFLAKTTECSPGFIELIPDHNSDIDGFPFLQTPGQSPAHQCQRYQLAAEISRKT